MTSYVAVAAIGKSINRFGRNAGNLAAQDARGDGENRFAIYCNEPGQDEITYGDAKWQIEF